MKKLKTVVRAISRVANYMAHAATYVGGTLFSVGFVSSLALWSVGKMVDAVRDI